MKQLTWLVGTVFALTLVISGCSKQEESAVTVDTTKMEKSFAQAEPDQKTEMNKAVSEIKAQNFAAASATLQKLAADAKLTPEQKQAIQDVIDQVKEAIAQAAKKVTEEAGKAMEGMKDAMPK